MQLTQVILDPVSWSASAGGTTVFRIEPQQMLSIVGGSMRLGLSLSGSAGGSFLPSTVGAAAIIREITVKTADGAILLRTQETARLLMFMNQTMNKTDNAQQEVLYNLGVGFGALGALSSGVIQPVETQNSLDPRVHFRLDARANLGLDDPTILLNMSLLSTLFQGSIPLSRTGPIEIHIKYENRAYMLDISAGDPADPSTITVNKPQLFFDMALDEQANKMNVLAFESPNAYSFNILSASASTEVPLGFQGESVSRLAILFNATADKEAGSGNLTAISLPGLTLNARVNGTSMFPASLDRRHLLAELEVAFGAAPQQPVLSYGTPDATDAAAVLSAEAGGIFNGHWAPVGIDLRQIAGEAGSTLIDSTGISLLVNHTTGAARNVFCWGFCPRFIEFSKRQAMPNASGVRATM